MHGVYPIVERGQPALSSMNPLPQPGRSRA
jgi:hypothetical protein